MNLKELIDSVEKTDRNKGWVNIEELGHDLGISRDLTYYLYDDRFPELTVYSTSACWMCTDTMVGIEAYYLNEELVAVSAQQARKSDKEYEWVSEEKAKEVHDLILSRCRCELNIKTIYFNQDVTSWVERGKIWREHVEKIQHNEKLAKKHS